jgi:dihydrofolate reductase
MLAIIAAKSKNNVIGFEGKMPWKQRNDLQRFKSLTYGHSVIMGRKTYASMGGKALPNRSNYVLTTNISVFCELYKKPGPLGMDCTVAEDLEHVCKKFYKMEFPNHMYLPTGFIIGGERLYRDGMEKADLLYITELDCEVEGDAFFPEIDLMKWKKVSEEKYKADEHNQYDYSFVTYARIPPPLPKGPGFNVS